MPGAKESFYDQVGGHETFQKLVHEFYVGVAGDPPLREMYPEEDLGLAEGPPRTPSAGATHGCGCATTPSR
jgi:truncated hemoglobin YjbI